MTLEQEIKDKAFALGFDAVGITDASPIGPAHVERLKSWLSCGHAGEMHYMHRNFEKRISPARLLEGAESVIVVGLNYKPLQPRAAASQPQASAMAGFPTTSHPQISLGAATGPSRPKGVVAQYARYEDYHDFMRPRLHELADFVRSITNETHRFKVCVDSAPLAERALAARAGVGYIGKNHMLIHATLGPQIFLGELLTTLRLGPDAPIRAGCSDCRRCVEACPTGALRADGQLDAGTCISYLTIEHRGNISRDLAGKIGDRLFGCDECVLACPHQVAAPACSNRELKFHPEWSELELYEVLRSTREPFEAKFGHSPISRTGVDGLKRNARICMENSSR